jgi:hypothetical protein
MLFLSIIIYLILSWFVSKLFSDEWGLNVFFLAFFLCTITINIVVSEVLNFFNTLADARLYLVAQLALCALLSWVVIGQLKKRGDNIFSLPRFVNRRNYRFIDYFLIGSIGVILLALFLIGVTTPPNNLDSLHTHLPRIYYWLQHGNLSQYIATTSKQNTYPINAHLQGLWLFLFSRNASFFFCVQWFSLVVALAVIYRLSQLCGLTITQGLFGALVFLSFPVVLLQAFTFQGDIIVSTLLMICFLFTFEFIRARDLKLLAVAFLALALALGTKQTAFFLLPAYSLLIIYLLASKALKIKQFTYLGVLFVFFLTFSSYTYIQNTIISGLPFGAAELQESGMGASREVLGKIEYNSSRLFYQFVSFDGVIGNSAGFLTNQKALIFERFTHWIGLDLESEKFLSPGVSEGEHFNYGSISPLSEDNSWFGPLSFILFPLALIFSMAGSKNRLMRRYLYFSILVGVSYLLLLVIQRPGWDPYQGRYFIIPVATFSPLLGVLIPAKRFGKALVGGTLLICTLSIACAVLLFNTMKPVITAATAWKVQGKIYERMETDNKVNLVIGNYLTTRINTIAENLMPRKSIYASDYYERLFYNENALIPDIKFIDANVPTNASIFIKLNQSPLEFALFGRFRTRNLYPYKEVQPIKPGFLLIVENDLIGSELENFNLVGSNDRFSIFK